MSSSSALGVIRPGPSLAGRTTLGIGGRCLAEAVVRTQDDLDQLAMLLATERGRPFVLGGGSNLLAAEGELDLVILSVANDELALPPEGGGRRVRAGAGMKLPVLLSRLQKAGLSGLEGLAGIPGTVGGALAMNAGSWGVEMGDRVVRAGLWSPLGGLVWVEREHLDFGYRRFTPDIPGKWVVWAVELELKTADQAAIKAAMDLNMAKKKAGQPIGKRTAGCVFKNPEGQAAGKLLDEAGMKGRRVGSMEFSPMHANFMVNTGGGTFAQAVELMDMGRQTVSQRFGVELETEVIVLS